jgi:hypothetical protein
LGTKEVRKCPPPRNTHFGFGSYQLVDVYIKAIGDEKVLRLISRCGLAQDWEFPPDERTALVSQIDAAGSDIMIVENFRQLKGARSSVPRELFRVPFFFFRS